MTKSEVIRHFGNASEAADKLNRSKGAVSQWPEQLPFEIQCYIEVMTGGALKAEKQDPSAA